MGTTPADLRCGADLLFASDSVRHSQLAIGKSEFLRAPEQDLSVSRQHSRLRSTICRMFLQEPASILVSSINFVDRHAVLERLGEIEDAFRVRDRELSSAAFQHRHRLSAPSPHKPKRLISKLRSAFCNASLNVRPIAIASPTLFICVVSVGSACGNFSKVNRGTLTTQ